MGRGSNLLDPLKEALTGVSVYQSRLKMGQTVLSTDLIQNDEDLDKVKRIARFIVSGVYIPSSGMYDNHRMLLQTYNRGDDYDKIAQTLGVHHSSIRRIGLNIIGHLDAILPKPCIELLRMRAFDDILYNFEAYKENNSWAKVESKMGVLRIALNSEGTVRKKDLVSNLSELSEEEQIAFKESTEKLSDLIKSYEQFVSDRQNLIYYKSLVKALEERKFVPHAIKDALYDCLEVLDENHYGQLTL